MRDRARAPQGPYRHQEPDVSLNPRLDLGNRAILMAAHAGDLAGRNVRPEPAPPAARLPENSLGGLDLLEAIDDFQQPGQAKWD